jgi:hypothetical protein
MTTMVWLLGVLDGVSIERIVLAISVLACLRH